MTTSAEVGIFTRDIMLTMVRQGKKEKALEILDQALDNFSKNGNAGYISNSETIMAKDGKEILAAFRFTQGRLVVLLCPEGPVRYGDEQIWFEKKLMPATNWIQIASKEYVGEKPSSVAHLIGVDLDPFTSKVITDQDATSLMARDTEFLILWMKPLTVTVESLKKEILKEYQD